MTGRWIAALAALLLMYGAAAAETVLHRGNGADPETLDPQRMRSEGASWIGYDLYEPLLTVDVVGNAVPGAAERWTISDDRLIYTFTLRKGGVWSDGSPVTADDFVFAWRRLGDPKTLSDYNYFIWPVKNGRAVTEGSLPPAALGVEAIDPLTLKVTLEAPTAYFLASLQHISLAPVSRALVERAGDNFVRPGTLLSNGAYMLVESIPQGHIKLAKNPRFHAADSVAIDTVYFYPTENRESELRRFRAGELHTTYDVPDTQLDWLRANMPDSLRVAPYLGNYFYAYNLTREPWKSSAELRQALSLAVDRTALTEKITKGGERPAFTFVPPEATGYRSPVPEHAGWTQEARDAEAKRLLAAAGYGPGGKPLEVEIIFNTSENHRKMAIAIAAMWQSKLGAKVTLTNQEWKVFLETRNEKTFKDVSRHGWVADFDDAVNFLKLFHSRIGKQNPSGYNSPAYDALLDASALEADPAKRAALMAQAESLLLADLPMIPIQYHATQNMVSPRVKGWHDNLRNLHLTRYMSVAP